MLRAPARIAERPGGSGPGTPFAWRIASIGLVLGGLALGDLAARRVGRRGAAALIGVGIPALVLPLQFGGRREAAIASASASPPAPRSRYGPSGLPRVSVVVAARDEARALPGLIHDLGLQDHRDAEDTPRFDLVVIDDRSIDGTAGIAALAVQEAGLQSVSRIVRRGAAPASTGCGEPLADGKGAALAAVPAGDLRGDVIVVLDADARIGPGFVRSLAEQTADGAVALSCPIALDGKPRTRFSKLQGSEQRLDLAIQRGRFGLGGCSEFRGNGIVIRRETLVEAGGWHDALTEDLDLSSRIAALGHRVGVARDAEIHAEAVTTWSALCTQRLRWAEGALRRAFEHGPAVLGSSHLSIRARADFGAYVAQLGMPGILLGALAGGLARRRLLAAAGIAATWGGALALLGRDPQAAAFSAVWVPVVPAAALRIALRRGPVRYDKMTHVGTGAEVER
jgi:hypothetical protein